MKNLKRWQIRCAIIIFYVAVIGFATYIYLNDPTNKNVYGFLIHDESYFHCPSCGMTRAVYFLMRFNFGLAFYYNAFLVCSLPVIAYVSLTLTVNLFVGKKIIKYPKNYAVYLYVWLALYVIFGILRNFTTVIY